MNNYYEIYPLSMMLIFKGKSVIWNILTTSGWERCVCVCVSVYVYECVWKRDWVRGTEKYHRSIFFPQRYIPFFLCAVWFHIGLVKKRGFLSWVIPTQDKIPK